MLDTGEVRCILSVGTQFLIDFLLSRISGIRNLPSMQFRHPCQLCFTNERLLGEMRRWKKSTSPFALAVMGWEGGFVVFCSAAVAFSGMCNVRRTEQYNVPLSPSPSIFLQSHVFAVSDLHSQPFQPFFCNQFSL